MKENTKERPKPPRLLSDIISLGLSDMEALDPEVYELNDDEWHFPDKDGKCHVCLAGAVIARTIGIPPSVFASPSDLPPWETALIALNFARRGHYVRAYLTLHLHNHVLIRLGNRKLRFQRDLGRIKYPECPELRDPHAFIESMWEICDEIAELEKLYNL